MDLREACCLAAQAREHNAERIKRWAEGGAAASEYYQQARVQALFEVWKVNRPTAGPYNRPLTEPDFEWTSLLSAEERQPFLELVARFHQTSGGTSSSGPPPPQT